MTVQYILSIMHKASSESTKRELCEVSMVNGPRDFDDIFKKSTEATNRANNEYVTASGVFIDQKVSVHQNFISEISQLKGMTAQTVDFSGIGKDRAIFNINQWASDSTRGTINQIVNPLNDYSQTKMLLTNAAYFKGTWKTAFRPSFYEDGFKINERQRVHVPFMYQQKHFYSGPIRHSQTNKELGYFVELPYEANLFSMFILLPKEDVNVQTLIENVRLETILMLPEVPPVHDVNVTLPKFEIKFSESLMRPLSTMGLKNSFSGEASFPYLLKTESASISDMVQEAFISVDEKGTKAAAVTTVNVIALSATEPEDTVQFTVDRPFLAIITLRDSRDRVPLFISKIINPQSSSRSFETL